MTKFNKPQLNHFPYGTSTVVEVLVAVVVTVVVTAASVKMECLAAGRMPVNATC
jgi:hypothetical protein